MDSAPKPCGEALAVLRELLELADQVSPGVAMLAKVRYPKLVALEARARRLVNVDARLAKARPVAAEVVR